MYKIQNKREKKHDIFFVFVLYRFFCMPNPITRTDITEMPAL